MSSKAKLTGAQRAEALVERIEATRAAFAVRSWVYGRITDPRVEQPYDAALQRMGLELESAYSKLLADAVNAMVKAGDGRGHEHPHLLAEKIAEVRRRASTLLPSVAAEGWGKPIPMDSAPVDNHVAFILRVGAALDLAESNPFPGAREPEQEPEPSPEVTP